MQERMDGKTTSLFGWIMIVALFFVVFHMRTVYMQSAESVIEMDMVDYNRMLLSACNGGSVTPTIVQTEKVIERVAVEDGTPITAHYVGEFEVDANCCELYNHICGGTGVTASGMPQVSGITAGANFDALAAGTWIYIEGVGIRQVQDTGPDCPMNHIDVAVETHEEALAWKLQGIHRVWILEVNDV